MNIRIANRLLEYRRASGYSQEELAAKIGVSRQAVSKWERVEASPDTDNLIALAKLYGITIDELINGSNNPSVKGGDDTSEKADKITEESRGSCDSKNSNGNTGSNTHDNKDNEDESEYDDENHTENDEDYNCDECSGNKNKTDRVHIGFDGIHVTDKNGDEVHVSMSGIHIEDKNGEKVHIDPGNIHIHNEKGDTVIETKDGRVYVNDEIGHRAPFWFDAILPIITLIAYLIMGFTIPDSYGWTRGWLVFFLVPVAPSFITAIRKGKPSRFLYPVFITGLYLLSGMVYGRWHPEWIAFLTIPVYYIICGAIEHSRKNIPKKHCDI